MDVVKNRFFLKDNPEETIDRSKERIASLENKLKAMSRVVVSLQGMMVPDIGTIREKWNPETSVCARSVGNGKK